ncbi:MAG: Nif3-like dinuclear metal center hexameric protein [Evtepia sp.]|nr:Nif3-like dinuclear metal center hexameric protein [Evtepia sp.]
MATVGEVYRYLDQMAPFGLQLNFDNAGFLVGKQQAEVSRVLIALDVTTEVIAEAIEKNVDLIVTHHPVIWGTIASVTDQDQTGKKLLSLIENGIAAICAHTNLDAVEGGVNSELARRLKLKNPNPLHEDGVDKSGAPYGIGRVGDRLEGPVPLDVFVLEVKEALDLDGIRVLDSGRSAFRIAVGGGSCGSMITDVHRHGCDTFITADVKHDTFLEARALGINLLDAGHYATETVICPVLARWLREAFPTLSIEVSECQGEVFVYR